MNWNITEAEDALSIAKIKAFKKVQKFAGQISNLKAWLMQLTSNLCKDIISKRSRGPGRVEDIEWVGETGVLCTASAVATPMMVLEMSETYVAIRRAVASLPQGQRDTFVLHYYEGLKHKEIVERLGISYDSVCKRISLARQQLKRKLRGYFCDEEELETALEPKLPKSPTPRGRAKKRKIGSPVEKGKELATVETARACVVGEGLPDFKDGAVEHPADVGEKMVVSVKNSAKLSTPKDCAAVVGEEKLDLVSGAVEHPAHGCSSRKEGCALGLAPKSTPSPLFIVDKQNILSDDTQGMVSASVSAASTYMPGAVVEKPDDVKGVVPVNVEQKRSQVCTMLSGRSPCVTPVGSGEQMLCSPLGGERATVSTAPEWVQVLDIVGQNILDVSGKGSARSPFQAPPGIVEMQRLQLGEELNEETVTVRAARAMAPVVVEEKPDDVRTVVRVDVEQKLSDVRSRARSPSVTPVGSGEKLSPSLLGPERATVSTAPEWVPVAALQDNCCGAVVPKDIVGQNIKDVCEYGSARSPGRTAIVEKLPIQFSTSREYGGVAVRLRSPLAVGEILNLVWDAVPLWAFLGRKIQDVCGKVFARSPSDTPLASGEKQKIQYCRELGKETPTVSAGMKEVGVGEKPDLYHLGILEKACYKW